MKSKRIGLGGGTGKGYKNIIRTDPIIHSNVAKGRHTYDSPHKRKMLTQAKILKRSPYFSSPKPFAKMPKIKKGSIIEYNANNGAWGIVENIGKKR